MDQSAWVMLTLATVSLVVLAVTVYLIGITFTLLETRRDISDTADVLESIARHTAPLEQQLVTVNGALSALAAEFETVDRHLGRATAAFGL